MSQNAVPVADLGTPTGWSAPVWAPTDERKPGDPDYATSSPYPAGDTFTIQLGPLAVPPPDARQYRVTVRAKATAGGTLTVTLFQGSRVIAARVLSPGVAFHDEPLDLTETAIGRIDYAIGTAAFRLECVAFLQAIQSYAQNFDSLSGSGTSNTWTDNSTIANRYAHLDSTSAPPANYRADDETSNTGAVYSYGAAGSDERALGVLASGATGTIYFGVKVVNGSGVTVNTIRVRYTGEQWRSANTIAQTLAFHHALNATGISPVAGTWVADTALDFTSPKLSNVGPVDGNNPANRVTFGISLSVLVSSGASFWLRCSKSNALGTDHGLAVDDLTVEFYA